MEFLFHEFTQSNTDIKDYRGYRLLAVDGSDLHIATDPADTDTYFQSQPNTKGYNLLHLNAAYDFCNRLYVDAIVQPRRLCNEGRALAAMGDRSPIKGKTIVIADRGYESYNNFAHVERVISRLDKRHQYQVNFTVAVYVCRHFLRTRGDELPLDVEALIRKNILPIRPIRPGQKNTRKIRSKSAVSFVYRVAKFGPYEHFFKRIFHPLCLLCAFFLACTKTNGTGLIPMLFWIPSLFPVLSLS